MTKCAECCAAARGTTNPKTCAPLTATGTTTITETTTWDFVLPVRLQSPEPTNCMRVLCRACPKVSMTDHPVLKRMFQAEDRCQEDRPVIRWIAGFLLLIISGVGLAQTQASNPPRCSGLESAGPEMVILPAGSFDMGSPPDEAGRNDDEGPQRKVEIASFALAVCEVTVADFRRFVQTTSYKTEAEASGQGCFHNSQMGNDDWDYRPEFNWQNALHGDSGDHHPVVCVSWNDANAYAAWLSEKAGAEYRLPTEAEWEYAARAGTDNARYYGDQIQCGYANGSDRKTQEIYTGFSLADCDDGYVHTAPVSSFAPNNWGLYDMLGNAFEWTQDCWHDDYTDGPNDGSAWQKESNGNCDRRVLRGGSWGIKPVDLRAAIRGRIDLDSGSNGVGFRLARTISPSEP